MSEPTTLLQVLRASTAGLLAGLERERWSAADVAAPSLCEGWTRGHVLTHLARNADGATRTISAGLRGEVVPRYDSWDVRNADIAAGAGRPPAAVTRDVAESAQRLDRVLGVVAETDGWDLPTDHGHPISHWIGHRFREIKICRVDLAGAYGPQQGPRMLIVDLLLSVAADAGFRAATGLRIEVVGSEAGRSRCGCRSGAPDGADSAAVALSAVRLVHRRVGRVVSLSLC